MKPESVSFIGSGNVAWHLAPALDNVGYAVREVYSVRKKNAAALSDRLYQSIVKDSLDFSDSPSGIFVIAVSDDAIAEVVESITLPPDALLVHTSGSKPLQILDNSNEWAKGVFYPLQTFTKNKKTDLETVPFFIESDDPSVERRLMLMAKAISKNVIKVSSQERKIIHVSAVFASNFTNHMLRLSKDIMVAHGLNFDHLKPLIAETLNKSLAIGPELAQTGPARRGDLEVLDNHLALLQEDEAVAEIYKVISQHILNRYSE